MNKQFLSVAACAFLFMGCSENERIEGGIPASTDNKVRFGATTGRATRAGLSNPFTTPEQLQKHGTFYVVGFDGLSEYLGKKNAPQEVTWQGSSWEYPNEPYWPNTPVTFYAYANWEGTDSIPNIDPSKGIHASVTIGQDAGTSAHKDLLVAAATGSKAERTVLTFKHALTQVVFKAGTVNSTIEVEIGGVTLVNIAKTGDMNYSLQGGNAGQIVWSTQDVRKAYVVNYINNTAGSGFKVPNVSVAPTNYPNYTQVQTTNYPADNSLLLIPQRFAAWQPSPNTAASAQTGAYIKVEAIVRKAGSDDSAHYYCGKAGGDPGLVGDTYGTIYLPVSSVENQLGEWKPGKRMNYILTFGDTNSGSGGGGYDENGDPILVPIRFTTEVENWTESDVPLLTVTFEASSAVIDGPFVASYVQQLLNDVQAANSPRLYRGKVTIKGSLRSGTTNSELLTGIDFTEALNKQFLENSTIELNFKSVTNWNGKQLTLTLPNGWNSDLSDVDGVITLDAATPVVTINRQSTPN